MRILDTRARGVAVVSSLLLVVVSCQAGFRKEHIWSILAPDDSIAVTVLRDGGGGAWSSFNYSLILVPADGADRPASSYPARWQSSGCPPRYVLWQGSREVTVLVDMQRPTCANEAFADGLTPEGVVIRTRDLPGTDWKDIVAVMGVPVE